MQVLFICERNTGRSQIAMQLFNQQSKKHFAKSAGLRVGNHEGESLPQPLLDWFASLGLPLNDLYKKQVQPKMIEEADKVICVSTGLELPPFMSTAEIWDIPNPRGKDREFHEMIKNMFLEKIKVLLQEFGEDAEELV